VSVKDRVRVWAAIALVSGRAQANPRR